MRVVKYKTKLTEDQKAVLEKEFSVNRPDINKKMNSPECAAIFARDFLKLHEQTEEYLYMICMNVKLNMSTASRYSVPISRFSIPPLA